MSYINTGFSASPTKRQKRRETSETKETLLQMFRKTTQRHKKGTFIRQNLLKIEYILTCVVIVCLSLQCVIEKICEYEIKTTISL